MIYTITTNPSLDYTVETELIPGQVNRTESEVIYPGGKGINVSISLQRLGQETRALGFAAGRIGQTIRDLLDDLGCPHTLLELSGGGRETAAVTWDLSGIPEEGVWEGTFFVYAALPGEYRLGDGVTALAVLLDLGGAEMYDDVQKFVSKWSYVPQSGSPITEPEPFRYCTDLHFPIPADRSHLINRLRGMLPDRILCMGYNTNNQLVLAGFAPAEGQTGTGYLQGYVEVTWNIEAVLNSAAFGNMSTFTFEGAPVSNPGYNIRVNSNNTDLPDTANDTSEIQGVLNLTVTLYDVDLSSHTKTAANPANTTVNLFDYCVDPDRDGADGKDDRLTKSDWHQGQTTRYARTAEDDWKKGINKGHLLIFGDGLIHAGYWNKGAGAITDFGKANAGMMGIVESTLKDDYPVINTAQMNESIDGFSDITDYLLCGDHDPGGGEAYTSINPKNISETVQKQWNGSDSLDYLFDPAIAHDGKTSYTNVEGLFQLDPMGYYYYDMRQNFAEYDGDTNRFILYDAPAAQRTDNSYENGGFGDKRSVGNFLPFNTAEQVFDGVRDGRLYSSESIGGERDGRAARSEGLHQATDSLKDFFFLEQLDSKEKASISLNVALDGETHGNTYQNTMAKLQMNFAVEQTGSTTTTRSRRDSDRIYTVGSVQTGDQNQILLWSLLSLLFGLGFVGLAAVSLRRQKGGEDT